MSHRHIRQQSHRRLRCRWTVVSSTITTLPFATAALAAADPSSLLLLQLSPPQVLQLPPLNPLPAAVSAVVVLSSLALHPVSTIAPLLLRLLPPTSPCRDRLRCRRTVVSYVASAITTFAFATASTHLPYRYLRRPCHNSVVGFFFWTNKKKEQKQKKKKKKETEKNHSYLDSEYGATDWTQWMDSNIRQNSQLFYSTSTS